jgi:hypothetical protein
MMSTVHKKTSELQGKFFVGIYIWWGFPNFSSLFEDSFAPLYPLNVCAS